MRNLIAAAIATALLTGCPQEQKPTPAALNDERAATEQVRAADATTILRPMNALASAPHSGADQVVKALGGGLSAAQIASAASDATPLAAARPPRNDANADGRSDLTWTRVRGSERYIAHWRMNGASVQQTTGPTLITAGTTFVRNGDYDGDRRTDQLWFNAADNNRQLTLARQNETGGFELSYVATIGAGWGPYSSVDINADGKSDVVWLDKARGLIAYWLMSGTTVLGSKLYTVDTQNYDLIGSGDFDGDGRGDLLWLGHRTNGPLYMWRSRSDGAFDQLLVGDLSIAEEFGGIADLNGDGRDDLVFSSYSRANFTYWMMNGNSVQQRGSIPIDPVKYEIAAVGDYDGDGKGDIMWTTRAREETAALYLWRGRGTGAFDSVFVAYYDHGIWETLGYDD